MREAEHAQAHTVETTIVQLEHHNKEGSQDNCIANAVQSKVVVLTPRTARLGDGWRCGDIVDIDVDSDN